MEPRHAQRKPRYSLYFGLLALGITAAIALMGFSLLAAEYALGGLA